MLLEENTPQTVCEADPGGEYIEYWTYEPSKIFVECPQINVGIGTSAPAARLDVRGQTYSRTLSVNTYDQEAKVTIKGGSPGSQNQFKALEVQDHNGYGAFQVFNDGKVVSGSGYFNQDEDRASIYLGDENHYVSSVYGKGISLSTYDAEDALVIQQGSGKVLIGETWDTNPTSNFKLQVNGGDIGTNGIRIDKQFGRILDLWH